MTPLPPTNIVTTIADLDGATVVVTWDDPNTDTVHAYIYNSGGSGKLFVTANAALKLAYVPGGAHYQLGLDNGVGTSPLVPFTAGAATQPSPPPTYREVFAAKLGLTPAQIQNGDTADFYSSPPATSATVDATWDDPVA